MKNIFLFPTDKPSRLFYSKGFECLTLSKKYDTWKEAQHIYITSDVDIKEGEEFWYNNGGEWYKAIYRDYYKNLFPFGKEIILTTDPVLIQNGVQVIDDKFLEWFVKNPSCESVEVDRDEREVGNHLGGVVIEYGGYKIIIPKEEPKQETLEEAAERIRQESFMCCSLSKTIDYVTVGEREKVAFIEGAKWQQEQDKKMYSEEEIRNIVEQTIEKFYKHRYVETKSEMKEIWFEQFKKK